MFTRPRINIFLFTAMTISVCMLLFVHQAAARNPDVSSWIVNLSSGSTLGDNNDLHESPEIAVVGNTVHVVWIKRLEGHTFEQQLWYRRSTDGGRTWQESVPISRMFDYELQLAHYPNCKRLYVAGDVVHIAYLAYNSGAPVSYRFFYRRSVDNGETFEEERRILNTSGILAQRPQIIKGYENNISIYFVTYYSGYILHSSDNGETFTLKEIFRDIADARIWDAYHAQNGIYVLYANSEPCPPGTYSYHSKLFFAASRDGGATFQHHLLSLPGPRDGCHIPGWHGQSNHFVRKLAVVEDTVSVLWLGYDADGVADGVFSVLLQQSHDRGNTLEDMVVLYRATEGLPAIRAGTENIVAKGDYLYALWQTTDEQAMFRGSSDKGEHFSHIQASSGSIKPMVVVDGASANGDTAQLFWQGTLRTATQGGTVFSERSMLFPLLRHNWRDIPQIDSAADGTFHYVMLANFYSIELCDGHCQKDVFYRRHSFTPPVPTGSTNLRVQTEQEGSFEHNHPNMHVPGSADINAPGAFSIDLWIKPTEGGLTTGFTDQRRFAVSKRHDANNTFSYGLGIVNGTAVPDPPDRVVIATAQIFTTEGHFSLNTSYTNKGFVPFDAWSHLAMTYDPAGGENNFSLHLNGELVESTTAQGTVVSDGNPMYVGRYGVFDLDDLKFWNRALTQAEILASMFTGQCDTTGLTACYNFDNTTRDMTGRSNHGILMFKERFVVDTRGPGSLIGTIEPEEAQERAQWRRVDTQSWRDSGATESNVPPGHYSVEFSILPGWDTVANQPVTVLPGQSRSVSVEYTPNGNQYPVSTSVSGSGGRVVSGAGTYLHNTLVRLTAVPDSGYQFAYWKNAHDKIVSTRAIYEFRATAGQTFTAHFRRAGLTGILMLLLE